MFTFDDPVMDQWNPELRKIDVFLRLGRARDKAEAAGIVAGYYHILRINPGAPLTVNPLTSPDGGFVEPSMAMLEALKGCDLQNDAVVKAKRKMDADRRAGLERDKARETSDRQREIFERFQAATRVHVSRTDVPWTNKVKGRKG